MLIQGRNFGCGLAVLGLVVVLFVMVSPLFSPGAAQTGSYQNPNYAAPKGDCFVSPKGDPLWDAHYAQEVNKPNCEAYAEQKRAQLPERIGKVITLSSASVGGLIVLLLIGLWVMAKGGKP